MAYIGNSQFRGVGVVTGGNIQDGSIESIDLATLTNIDVNGGSIDGAIIGANEAVAGNFSSIGIGTNSPNAGLQISKGADQSPPAAGSNTGAVCFGNDTSGNAYGLVMGADGFGKGYISAQRTDGTATTYDLVIQPNGGNVGIGGSSSADSKLLVRGDGAGSTTTSGIRVENQGSTSGGTYIKDTDYFNIGTLKSSGGPFIGYAVGPDPSTAVGYLSTSNINIGRASIDTGKGGDGVIRFLTGPVQESVYGSAVNMPVRMQINSNGNVGIGTESPVAKLHVWNPNGGNATDKATMLSEAVVKLQPHFQNSTNLLVAQVNDGNGMGLQVTNSSATANWDIALSPFGGNVGIGVTSPSTQLNVGHASHGVGMAYAAATLPDLAGIYTSSDSSHGQAYGTLVVQSRGDYSGYSISFRASNSEVTRMDSNGNVNINGALTGDLDHWESGGAPGVVNSSAATGSYYSKTGWWPIARVSLNNPGSGGTRYIHLKTNLVSGSRMLYFKLEGYAYNLQNVYTKFGLYMYSGTSILNKSIDNNGKFVTFHDAYKSSDSKLVLVIDLGNSNYTSAQGRLYVQDGFDGNYGGTSIDIESMTRVDSAAAQY